MLGNQAGGSSRKRSGRLARSRGQEPMTSSAEVNDCEGTEEFEDHLTGFFRVQNESSPSRTSFSSSLNQKTPARSYFQHSFQDAHGEIRISLTL